MPWKECSVMDERLQFVVRRLAGEPMGRTLHARTAYVFPRDCMPVFDTLVVYYSRTSY